MTNLGHVINTSLFDEIFLPLMVQAAWPNLIRPSDEHVTMWARIINITG